MPLLSPFLAMLAAMGSPQPASAATPVQAMAGEGLCQALVEGAPGLTGAATGLSDICDRADDSVARQVRIERRVILRISPQPGRQRNDFLADLPQQAVAPRLVERPFGECVNASDIIGVADRGSRLLMYMRNRQIISAQLEDACSPRDFYLGFYLEKNSDGKLCVGRDRLLSRAGAKCRVANLSRLTAVAEQR